MGKKGKPKRRCKASPKVLGCCFMLQLCLPFALTPPIRRSSLSSTPKRGNTMDED